MHPIEGSIYSSTCIFPLLFWHHPMVVWIVKLDLAFKAYWGHDGYDYPGAGDWYHHVHHVKFSCNYGSSNLPFDWFFNMYETGEDVWDKEMENWNK